MIYIRWLQFFSLCNCNIRPCENCSIWTCFLSLNITFVSCFPPVDGPPENHRSWFRAAQRARGPDEYKNCITITVSVCACNHTHKRIWRACLLYLGLVLFPCCSFESQLGNITPSTVNGNDVILSFKFVLLPQLFETLFPLILKAFPQVPRHSRRVYLVRPFYTASSESLALSDLLIVVPCDQVLPGIVQGGVKRAKVSVAECREHKKLVSRYSTVNNRHINCQNIIKILWKNFFPPCNHRNCFQKCFFLQPEACLCKWELISSLSTAFVSRSVGFAA